MTGWEVGLRLNGSAAAWQIFSHLYPHAALAAAPVHVVRPGETLFRIARQYGVSVEELARYNEIRDPAQIRAGQRLRIPTGGAKRGSSAREGGAIPAPQTGRPSGASSTQKANGDQGGNPPPGGESRGGIVALTFDDGPDPATWPGLLEALEQGRARATFFLEGARARAHPELVRELVRRGHQVENHGWSHQEPAPNGEREVRAAIARTAALLRELTGRRTTYYRPPGGLRDPSVFRWAEAEGHRVLLWTNIGVPDVPPPAPGQLASRMAAHAYNGAILMLHATEPRTVQELPAILTALRQRGLRPVTVDQLMQALAQVTAEPPEAGTPGDQDSATDDKPATKEEDGKPAGNEAENKKEG
ncbi:MAG: polysaccharide deacetylase family protein [Symbiobacteriaceae bacterium]|nr:MAG: hypothetical protein DIU69_03870 [Bacillota bacterium]